MKKKLKIVLSADFSDFNKYVFVLAKSLQESFDVQFHVIHVLEQPNQASSKEAEQELKNRCEEHNLKDFTIAVLNADGALYETLLNYASEIKPSAIVVGAFGSGGKNNHFIGSNIERLCYISNIPIIIVRQASDKYTFDSVVFSSLFLDEAKKAYKKLAAIFSGSSKTHLLRVITPDLFERSNILMQIMKKFSSQLKISQCSSNICTDYSVEAGMISYANEVGASILAFTMHNRRRLPYIILGNQVDGINHTSAKLLCSVKVEDKKESISEEYTHYGRKK